MSARSKTLLLITTLAIAVFAGLSIYSDLNALGQKLSDFGWWAFAAALGLALANYLLRFIRWTFYLKGAQIKLPLGLSFHIFISGFALSVTPGKLGELIKSYLLREFRQVPIAKSAPLVVGERVTDLTALLVLGLVGVSAYGVAQNLVWIGAAIVGTGIFVLACPPVGRFAISVLTTPKFSAKMREPLLEFYAGLGNLVRPWPLCWATALATISWLGECIGFYLIVSAFPGVEVPLGLAILIYASTTIAGALSFLPGGLLVTEATMALLLVQSSEGLDQATAIAATMLIRLATLWFAVVLGVIAMALLRMRSPEAAAAMAAAQRKESD